MSFRALAVVATGAILTAWLVRQTLNGQLSLITVAGAGIVAIGLIVLGMERPGAWLMYAALFTAPMEDLRPGPESLLTLSDALLGLGILLLLPTLLGRRFQVPPMLLVGACLILPMLPLAALTNPDSTQLLINSARLVLAVIAVPAAMLWWRPSLQQLIPLAWAYVLGHSVSALWALYEGEIGNNRWEGLATHPNYFGHCAVIAVCLMVFLHQHIRRQWLLLVPFAAAVMSIALSGSRASALVAVMVVALYPVIERSVVAGYLLASGVTVGLLLSNRLATWLDNPDLDFLSRFRGDETTEVSDRERTEVLYDGLDRFLAKPLLGNGFDAQGLEAHNIYLQVAVGIGVVGLIGFLFIMATAVRTLAQGGDLYRLGYVAIAYASLGLLTNSLWDRFIWLPMAMALVAYARGSDTDSEAAAERSDSKVSATSVSANSRSASFRAR